MQSLVRILFRLRVLWLLSSLASTAGAHEVLPTIADFETQDGVVTFEFYLNLEGHLADIDLDESTDTDEDRNASEYDALRAQPAAEIKDRAAEIVAEWSAHPLLVANGQPLSLSLENVLTEEPDDPDVPRQTTLRLASALPENATSLVIAWPLGSGGLVVRQQGVDEPFTGLLNGGDTSPAISLSGGDAQTGWQAFLSYIPVGFDHIVPKGLDHILFVLGLFFLSPKLGALLWQVSAFTLAHTVTLALGALGWVNVPGSIVEPLIAASIVAVAVENIVSGGLSKWRPLVIFGFGLLHGLGFASVLGDFGLPEGQFIPALLGFNIGVELGQLAVIAVAFALVFWAVRKEWYRRVIAIPASLVIAAIGAYWVVERTLL